MHLRLTTISVLLISASIFGQGSPELAIPASYKYDLQLPGEGNDFRRPARIFTDHKFNEVYVADPGNARVLIFNEDGIFRYEFSVGEYMGSPLDLVVNSDGYIIVLGSTRQGMRLFTFDYDGLYLGHFNSDESAVELAGTSSLAIDDQDRVYALIHSEGVVVRCGTHGEIQQTFPVEDDIEEEEQLERVYGSMYFAGGLLYVPISSHGTVMRLTPDGKLVDNIGFKGTLIGQLNFPVCVAVTSDGIIMILDKHRFNIVCFSQKGKFLAEFGGKGTSPGWFYHPTWIAIDGSEQVYIGQIFNNRIQVLSIPQLVYDRKSKVDGQATRNPAIDTQIGVETSNNQSSRRWSRNELSAFDCVEDDILHEQISLKLTVPKNPIQLAFTESVGGIYNA